MTLPDLLARSAASDAFKEAVLAFDAGRRSPRIGMDGFAPRVKVMRTIMQLLATEPTLCVEEIHIDGQSGCSDFVGRITVTCADSTHVYAFAWDCRWRAEQEGWADCFGFPDQIRAAREFGWDCFARWETVSQSVHV